MSRRVTRDIPVTHDSTLDGAGDLPPEGTMLSDAAEFAAAWNRLSIEQRAEWFVGWAQAMNDASRCALAGHDGLVHQHAALARAILKTRRSIPLDDVDEVAALPERSIVVDCDGDAWQRRGSVWLSTLGHRWPTEDLANYSPVKVLAIGDVS